MKKKNWGAGMVAILLLTAVLGVLIWVRAADRPMRPAVQPGATVTPASAETTPEPEQAPLQAEIRLLGEESLVLECGEAFSDPGAEAWLLNADGSRGEALEIRVSPAPDTARPGEVKLNYEALYGGQTLASVTRHVTVQDTQPPILTLLNEPGEHDFRAEDAVDGDLTGQVRRVETADLILYSVSDSSGNEARAERLKTPVLSFTGGDSVQIPADYKFFDPGFTATDMYGRDLSDRVEITGSITPWKPGSYELTYTVTDEDGRSVSAKRSVEVVKASMPDTVLQEKVIYLTFDDGPAGPTEELLDMLAKYPDVKVTFFVTNTDQRYTDMIGRAYRDGHSIGLHAYAHDASKIYTSEEDYFYYFDLMEELIYEQTGAYTRIVRFVGGSSNTSSMYFADGIMSRLAEDLTNMGYRYYDWNMQPENAECNEQASYSHLVGTSEFICREGQTVPISLQHDTAQWNIRVAERFIQWGLANGYTFKGIDMTTPEVHHLIRN